MITQFKARLRLLILGCDSCGRRWVSASSDGYSCQACYEIWCRVVLETFKARLDPETQLRLMDDNFSTLVQDGKLT